MARTMDDFKAPASTWGAEISNYTHQKRHAVDSHLVSGKQLHLPMGAMQAQERTFDPVLGRYRDGEVEARQRHHEERERVAHLNRAKDIQILREQPFHILHHQSKLEKLAPGKDPMRLGGSGLGEQERTKHGRGNFPGTATDYNILSNIPHAEHHWARGDERPRLKEKSPRGRKIPAFNHKDFHIITNRYSDNHSEKMRQEKRVQLLEATDKHMQTNKFDPVVGKFNDPRTEEQTKTIDHAREVEITLRADEKLPPSYKGRLSASYGLVSHQKHDPDMLRLWDTMEDEKKDRYRNRYIVEHNLHAQDIKGDHINEVRQLNRIAPERFEEPKRRGFDIVNNKVFGPGEKEQHFHEAFPPKRQTPWEKIEASQAVMGQSQAIAPAYAASRRPEEVQTIRLPADATSQAPSGRKRLESSGSAPQLRHSDTVSVRSHTSSKQSMRRSESAAIHAPRMPLAATPFAPPAPSVPGSQTGSVYSRPSRA